MSDEADKTDRASLWPWLVAVCLAPVLYLLSFGPVIHFGEKVIGQDVLRAAYAPVVWLHANTPLKGPIEWYAALWGVK